MNRIIGFFQHNDFLSCPENTLTYEFLKEEFNKSGIVHKDITIYQGLIKYPRWPKTAPIFRQMRLSHLRQLKKDKKTFFIFDASTEGFSTIYDQPFFDVLYFNCKEHGVDPERVIYISSNMLDHDNLKRYNQEHGITRSIKLMCFNNFESMLFGVQGANLIVDQHGDINEQANKRLKASKKGTKSKFKNKLFLSLSRVNRPHRTLSAWEIFHGDYLFDGLISHGNFNSKYFSWDGYVSQIPGDHGIEPKHLRRWNKTVLPLVADTEDFITNHAMFLNTHLHDQTLFQIVNETFAENWQGTSQFWSEKTFRSMFHMQPFIIWGQQGANKKLQEYGYQLFDCFDYSFDNEPDDYKRWKKIYAELERVVLQLRNMTWEEQVKWKYAESDKLLNNFKTMLAGKHTRAQFFDLCKYMRDTADGKTINS